MNRKKNDLLNILNEHMVFDDYCKGGKSYKVQNIYYDTINNTLISKSIEKPLYKAKVRVRHYIDSETYFLEWKQKTNRIVSKRRVALDRKEFIDFLIKQKLPQKEKYLDKQIIDEFSYFLEHNSIFPALYLTYNRIAMHGIEDKDLRLTIDDKIYGNRNDFSWNQEKPNIKILDDGRYVLEIKYNHNYPLWLASTLSKLKIYHKSFSKYGEEYKTYINNRRISI